MLTYVAIAIVLRGFTRDFIAIDHKNLPLSYNYTYTATTMQ